MLQRAKVPRMVMPQREKPRIEQTIKEIDAVQNTIEARLQSRHLLRKHHQPQPGQVAQRQFPLPSWAEVSAKFLFRLLEKISVLRSTLQRQYVR